MVLDPIPVHFFGSRPQPPTSRSECVIYLQAEAVVVLMPCGHLCLCEAPACMLKLCPLCRSPVVESRRSYGWKMSTFCAKPNSSIPHGDMAGTHVCAHTIVSAGSTHVSFESCDTWVRPHVSRLNWVYVVLVQIAPLFIQIAPLFIRQPHGQNQSIALCCIMFLSKAPFEGMEANQNLVLILFQWLVWE